MKRAASGFHVGRFVEPRVGHAFIEDVADYELIC
jgi:hypothetical protein